MKKQEWILYSSRVVYEWGNTRFLFLIDTETGKLKGGLYTTVPDADISIVVGLVLRSLQSYGKPAAIYVAGTIAGELAFLLPGICIRKVCELPAVQRERLNRCFSGIATAYARSLNPDIGVHEDYE